MGLKKKKAMRKSMVESDGSGLEPEAAFGESLVPDTGGGRDVENGSGADKAGFPTEEKEIGEGSGHGLADSMVDDTANSSEALPDGAPPADADVDAQTEKRLADFIFEVGMLRKTPRTGYQFLGSGGENVAEHSYRATVIGYVLARRAGADPERTAMMCLFHDLHEARTGDFNYVNSLYNSSNDRKALEDATRGTGLDAVILSFWDELEDRETLEARLAHDADQLDLIFNLLQEKAMGNRYAEKWLVSARERLKTEEAKALAAAAEDTDPAAWWFTDPSDDWWVNKNNGKK